MYNFVLLTHNISHVDNISILYLETNYAQSR